MIKTAVPPRKNRRLVPGDWIHTSNIQHLIWFCLNIGLYLQNGICCVFVSETFQIWGWVNTYYYTHILGE